jgi:hypothetical protein
MTAEIVDRRKRGTFWMNDEVVRTLEASCYVKMVYTVLVSHADSNGLAFPQRETIAREGGMSVSQVKRAMQELSDRGIIRIEHANGSVNRYYLLDKDGWVMGADLPGSTRADHPVLPEPGQGEPGSTRADHPVLPEPTPGSTRTPKEYPIKEYPVKDTHREDVCALEAFKKAYPIPDLSGGAMAVWNVLNPDETLVLEIMTGLSNHKQTERWIRGIGIPDPDRYLREQWWKNAPSPAARSGTDGTVVSRTAWTPRRDGTWVKSVNGVDTVIDRKDVPIEVLSKHRPSVRPPCQT